MRTSDNSVKWKSNFREFPFYDVRRIRATRGDEVAVTRPLRHYLLGLYLKETNLIPLHADYRVATSLRRLFAQPIGRLLRDTHGFFALPEGNAKSLATVAVTEGDHAFEAVHQPPLGQYHLPGLAQSFIHELWGTLQGTHPRVHSMPPLWLAFLKACQPFLHMHDATDHNRERTSENAFST